MSLKSLLLSSSRALGLQALAQWHHRQRLIVLCYHGVVSREQSENAYLYRNTVSVAEFESHLDQLSGCNLVSLAQVLAWVRGEDRLPSRPVLITFDDGYRNNASLAAPILARRGHSALVSVSVDYIDSDRQLWPMEVDLRVLHWPGRSLPLPGGKEVQLEDRRQRESAAADLRRRCKSLPDAERREYLDAVLRQEELPGEALADEELWRFMSWNEVRELRGMGIEVASHTCSHPILSRLQEAELEHELSASRARIEAELGEPCRTLVYPNGGPEDVTSSVLEAVGRSGYQLAFTLMDAVSPRRPEALAIDRIGIPGHCNRDAFRWRSSGLHSLLRALR
ncbi:MAG: polysaccharide deacetylase family protein [Planctomycetota bacterium]|jgi:peptidoglycan/xylan/chitin deacetylase (PgdA/CDA1 family)